VVTTPDKQQDTHQPLLPAEVEIYINPDGSVTFADLEASLVPVAQKLASDSTSLDAEPPGSSKSPEG
jgi:hypothetical protein